MEKYFVHGSISFFCGGEVAEDIQKYLRPTLENIPFNRVPSADTLHRVLKELATENTTITSVSIKNISSISMRR